MAVCRLVSVAAYLLHLLVEVLQDDIQLVVERDRSEHQVTEIVGLGSLAFHPQMDL